MATENQISGKTIVQPHRYVSPNGYTADYGPNVEQILARGSRIIEGKVPAQVRKELAFAVKAGVLGRLKKDGLKPEIYYHPNSRVSALHMQQLHAAYSVNCIAKVMHAPTTDERIEAALSSLVTAA